MDKSQRQNMEFEREDKRKTRKQNRIRRKKGFKDKPFGGTKKTQKLQEKSLFGLIPNKKSTRTARNKNTTTKNKRTNKKTPFLHVGKQPLFLVKFMFFQLTLFYFCKAVFCWKHYKNCVFNRAQLLCITDSKTPFRGENQNGTFETESAILGCSLCLLKPQFL